MDHVPIDFARQEADATTLELRSRGPWPLPNGPRVAIVGARRPTSYGKAVAERLAQDLATQDVLVVGGLSRGTRPSPTRPRWTPAATPSPAWARASTSSTRPRLPPCFSRWAVKRSRTRLVNWPGSVIPSPPRAGTPTSARTRSCRGWSSATGRAPGSSPGSPPPAPPACSASL